MIAKQESRNLLVADSVLAFEAQVVQSKIVRSNVQGSDSVIYKSHLVDSLITHSVVAKSRLLNSSLDSGSVVQQATIVDSRFELGSFVSGLIVGSFGRGVTIYDAVVIGVELDFGTHISDGVWMRKPKRFTHPGIPFDVTEGVEDQVIVGCWSRSVARWLESPTEVCERIGITRSQFEIYREAIIEIGAEKVSNPSPFSLKRKAKKDVRL